MVTVTYVESICLRVQSASKIIQGIKYGHCGKIDKKVIYQPAHNILIKLILTILARKKNPPTKVSANKVSESVFHSILQYLWNHFLFGCSLFNFNIYRQNSSICIFPWYFQEESVRDYESIFHSKLTQAFGHSYFL